ncbi:MAG: lipoate--protein ligase family protein [Chloroflexi bacterium HGW-Chloroflexi-6]|nr:MAG: lipoate--protein ligase family protein [Chloroflexi bacterium HGW-Chloroflexi-6]
MSDWRLILDAPAPGAWNMAVDEAILEHAGRGDSRPTLRLYAWQPACLSLGYAQPYTDVDESRLAAHGWDVVRRPTGGRAILHTDELTYSVTTAPNEPIMEGTVLESYNRIAGALLAACHSLDLPVSMEQHAPPAEATKGAVCFEVPSAYEIVLDGKKLIGSAQARKREGILQHGSLPLHGDLTRIVQALAFEDEVTRGNTAVRLLKRATTAENHLQRVIAWETAAQALVGAFQQTLGLIFERGELSGAEKARAEELVQKKYNHPAWNKRV